MATQLKDKEKEKKEEKTGSSAKGFRPLGDRVFEFGNLNNYLFK